MSSFFSALKEIIQSLYALSANERVALDRAVSSSRNDIQLDHVPLIENVPTSFISPLATTTGDTQLLDSSDLEKFNVEKGSVE